MDIEAPSNYALPPAEQPTATLPLTKTQAENILGVRTEKRAPQVSPQRKPPDIFRSGRLDGSHANTSWRRKALKTVPKDIAGGLIFEDDEPPIWPRLMT